MANLTASALTAAMYLQKDKWKDSARNAEYIAEVGAAKALIENTTAQIDDVKSSDKKKKVTIYWNKFTPETVITTTPNFCEIEGEEADSDSKTYEITRQVSNSFTIDEAQYEDNNLNISDVIADNMLKAKKANDEKIAQVLISALDSFTSPNLYHGKPGCPGVVGPPESWATTYIPAAYWTPELMHYFLNVKRINKLANPFLLDGSNINFLQWKSAMEAGTPNGSGPTNMLKAMKYYEDLVNMADVAPGKTFMVDRGATAFVNRSRWKGNTAANPILEPEIARKKYSEASENIPTLDYDVYITTDCSGPYKKHNFLVHGLYDLFPGPPNANGGTGVHEFMCGACPTV